METSNNKSKKEKRSWLRESLTLLQFLTVLATLGLLIYVAMTFVATFLQALIKL